MDLFMNYDEILCRRIQEVKPSGIRRFFDILEEMKDAISLGVGEPDFVTPWHIRDAGIYSLEKGFTKYTSNAGMAELRREIAAYLNRRFGLQYDFAHQIVVTVGGSEAIDLALRCILNPGDEVIIPVPSFVCYGPLTSMAGGTPVYVELKAENEFRLTAAQLRAALTPRTKAVVLPFPSNPTGGILERADLEALAGVLKDTNAMVISDEIYAELTYGQKHVSPANLPELYDRTIVVNGFSKSHAMTGWRIGYLLAPEAVIEQTGKIAELMHSSVNSLAQYAGVAALAGPQDNVAAMREEYRAKRQIVLDGLAGCPVLRLIEPQGAFYAFVDVRLTGLDSGEFADRLLDEERVAVVPGEAFGEEGRGFVRLSYAGDADELREGVARLRAFAERVWNPITGHHTATYHPMEVLA